MAKRVLIVENSLAVRGIAESLLRQNGYDVVAADSAEAAKSILNDSKIDLLLVASDIVDGQGQKFYEFVGAGSSTATIPLLVFHDSTSGADLPFPPEAIIQKPFTPADFLSSISAFSGGGDTQSGTGAPFDGADFEDDIIDAALGLDKLDINDSEVIGNDTGVFRLHNKKKSTESMIGYEVENSDDDSSITNKNIDQINVPADTQQPQQPPPPQPPQQNQQSPAQQPPQATEDEAEFLGNDTKKLKGDPKDLTESSKIEIITDQYGISIPEEELQPESEEDDVHDYNWFINELKGEAEGKKKLEQPQASAPVKPQQPAPKPQQKPAAGSKTDNVDDFISEFKKEMEKISDDFEPSLGVTNIPVSPGDDDPDLQWKESIADVPDDEIKTFSRELVSAIASGVAKRIMAELDEGRLYQIIKEVIDERIRSQFKKTS